MNTTTTELTIDNFAKETGFRFRVTKQQSARIALTPVSEADRTQVSTMDIEAAADFFNARSATGKALGWVEVAIETAGNWQDSMTLTREGAFTEFMTPDENGQTGLDRLQGRRPEIPTSVFLTDGLTLENFPQRVENAIGVAVRFRRSSDQTHRGLTREESLNESIALANTPNE